MVIAILIVIGIILLAIEKQIADLRREIANRGIDGASDSPHPIESHREAWLRTALRPKSLEELAHERTRALGWEWHEPVNLEEVVENAIRETGATSLRQMGIVIKAARTRLGWTSEGGDRRQRLNALVRSRLEEKAREKPLEGNTEY